MAMAIQCLGHYAPAYAAAISGINRPWLMMMGQSKVDDVDAESQAVQTALGSEGGDTGWRR